MVICFLINQFFFFLIFQFFFSLIFSAYVTVLNCVEHFMKLIQEKHENSSADGFENFEGPWVYGSDFYRIDGQTSRTDRYKMITKFNSKENKRTV